MVFNEKSTPLFNELLSFYNLHLTKASKPLFIDPPESLKLSKFKL